MKNFSIKQIIIITCVLLLLPVSSIFGDPATDYSCPVMQELHEEYGGSYSALEQRRGKANADHVNDMIDRKLQNLQGINNASQTIYYDPETLDVEIVHLDYRPKGNIYGVEVYIEPGGRKNIDVQQTLDTYFAQVTSPYLEKSIVYINKDGLVVQETRLQDYKQPGLTGSSLYSEGLWANTVYDKIINHNVNENGPDIFVFVSDAPSSSFIVREGSRSSDGKKLVSVLKDSPSVYFDTWDLIAPEYLEYREQITLNSFYRQEFDKWLEDATSSAAYQRDVQLFGQERTDQIWEKRADYINWQTFYRENREGLEHMQRMLKHNPDYYEQWREIYEALPEDEGTSWYSRDALAHENWLQQKIEDPEWSERYYDMFFDPKDPELMKLMQAGDIRKLDMEIYKRIEEERKNKGLELAGQPDIINDMYEAVEGIYSDNVELDDDNVSQNASKLLVKAVNKFESLAERAMEVVDETGLNEVLLNWSQTSRGNDSFWSADIEEEIVEDLENSNMLADPGTRQKKEAIWVYHDRIRQLEKNLFYYLDMRDRGTTFPDSILVGSKREIEEAREKYEQLRAESGLDDAEIVQHINWWDLYVYDRLEQDMGEIDTPLADDEEAVPPGMETAEEFEEKTIIEGPIPDDILGPWHAKYDINWHSQGTGALEDLNPSVAFYFTISEDGVFDHREGVLPLSSYRLTYPDIYLRRNLPPNRVYNEKGEFLEYRYTGNYYAFYGTFSPDTETWSGTFYFYSPAQGKGVWGGDWTANRSN